MSNYTPTPELMPGTRWEPSNGTEGTAFIDAWCSNCDRDKSLREGAPLDECDDNEVCPIVAASFRGEAVEWREMPNGDIKCISFVKAGDQIPPPRDERTIDMFAHRPVVSVNKV